MRRREFITLIGGAAAWPIVVRAQQPDPVRRVGALMNTAANDPQSSAETAALVGGLQERGWRLAGNLQIEYRWGTGDANLYQKYAAELVALAPDVLLAAGGTAAGALQRARARYQSYSCKLAIQSTVVWSRVWRNRAATLRDFLNSSSVLPENGWNCLSRSHRT